MRIGFLQVFYVLFSAALLALGIPNQIYFLGFPLFALFSLVPFYLALSTCKSFKNAFLLGYIHGLVVHCLSSFWLGYFRDFAFFTLGASAIGTGFVEGVPTWAMYFPFSSRFNKLEISNGKKNFYLALRPIFFAAVYTAYEFMKSVSWLAYPWGTLSSAAVRWTLVTQIASVTGALGVSFIFALFSSVIAEGILLLNTQQEYLPVTVKINRKKYQGWIKDNKRFFSWTSDFRLLTAIFALVLAFGIVQYFIPRKPVKFMNTVMVQQNVDPWETSDIESIEISSRLTKEKVDEFHERNKKVDVVVWSEGILGKPLPRSQWYYERYPEGESLSRLIKTTNAPFIIGGSFETDWETRAHSNAAHIFSKDGKYVDSYSKMHLVPFAESIPGVHHKWVKEFFKPVLGNSVGWVAGTQAVLFEVPISTPVAEGKSRIVDLANPALSKNKKPSVIFGTPICFDDAFPEVCRAMYKGGAEAFVNITNDAWSKTESAEYQHYAVASYRAIEYRTTLVRSTNAGFSVVIEPNGKILEKMPLFEECALAAVVPIYKRTMTTYARFGDWCPISLAIFAVLFLFYFSYIEGRDKRRVDVGDGCGESV